MNQRDQQNIFHVTVNVKLMVGNITQTKDERLIYLKVSTKN